MPLPSNTDLATLDIAYLGAPFVAVGPAVNTRVSGAWKS